MSAERDDASNTSTYAPGSESPPRPSTAQMRRSHKDPDYSARTAGAPHTGDPEAPGAANKETAEKLENAQLDYQKGLGFTQEVEELLRENAAYVWKKDERGNLLVRSTKLDKGNPRNWPNWKRYGIVILASTLNNLVRSSARVGDRR